MDLKDKKVLVLGYARTGRGAAEFLVSQGANVTINDLNDLSEEPSIEELKAKGVIVVDKKQPVTLLNENFDFIVKNPGIPYQIELLQAAIAQEIPIYTDIEIFDWYNPGILIGITGSNGKTTTTTLVNNILQNSQYQAHLAGNIGIPTLSVLPKVKENDVVTMELSSFQLMGTDKFKPHITAITNIFSAHLDYHGTREEYVKAKLRLIQNQDNHDFIIFNADQKELAGYVVESPANKVPFARLNLTDSVRQTGAYYENGGLYFKGELIMKEDDIQIPGEHNIENILVAIAITKILNVPNNIIHDTIMNYQGVEYRIQPVGIYNGISYYNDSKATNPDATITALKSFAEPTIYIGGGLDRGITFEKLVPYLENVKVAILYGESKKIMKEAMEQAQIEEIVMVDNLEQATKAAQSYAESGDVVLLSPACASWDQYQSFEERGAQFNELIVALNQ